MSMQGLPDWTAPLKVAGGDLYYACDEPRRAFAPPMALTVAAEADGGAALALELIRIEGGSAGPQLFGLLTIRFVADYALAERQAAVFAEYPDVKLEPLPPRGGFLRFEAAGALSLPDEMLAPRPLVWAGAGSLTFAAQLGQAATQLLNDALVNGLVTVTAVAELETWGVTSRTAARVLFDPAIVAALVTEASVNGACTLPALAAAIVARPDGAGLSIGGADTDAARVAAAMAFAERLAGRFAALAPADDPAAGAVYAFDTAAMTPGEITWDLSEAVLTPRAVVVASNPLETARRAAANGFRLAREAPVIPFATGLHVLSVFPNLPPKRVGALMLGVELRMPPFLPDRPQTVVASALFREGETSKTLNVRLSPNEPVAFDYQAVAFVATPGGAQRLIGPPRHHDGLHLTLPPDSFPVRFVRVEATPALLDAATLRVRCRGIQAGGPWAAEAVLDRSTSPLAFAVPRDLDQGVLEVTATAPEGGRVLAMAPRALEDCWLDLSSFPTAGPAVADIACAFDDGAGLAAIECVPEDRLDVPDAVGLVRLTPSAPRRDWRWLVLNPLFDGFRWRWFRPASEAPAPWSDRLDPAAGPLELRSSDRTAAAPGAMEGVQ
jgi:hypothetical protein